MRVASGNSGRDRTSWMVVRDANDVSAGGKAMHNGELPHLYLRWGSKKCNKITVNTNHSVGFLCWAAKGGERSFT